MSFTLQPQVANGGGSNKPEAGSHIARVVGIYHLGTQESEYEGEKKVNVEMWFQFEFPRLTVEIDGKEVPKTYGRSINYILAKDPENTKAKMNELCKALKVDPYVEGFQINSLLGLPLYIQVNDAQKISVFTPVPNEVNADDEQFAQVSDSRFFAVAEAYFDMDVFTSMQSFLRTSIMESPEFGSLPVDLRNKAAEAHAAKEAEYEQKKN